MQLWCICAQWVTYCRVCISPVFSNSVGSSFISNIFSSVYVLPGCKCGLSAVAPAGVPAPLSADAKTPRQRRSGLLRPVVAGLARERRRGDFTSPALPRRERGGGGVDPLLRRPPPCVPPPPARERGYETKRRPWSLPRPRGGATVGRERATPTLIAHDASTITSRCTSRYLCIYYRQEMRWGTVCAGAPARRWAAGLSLGPGVRAADVALTLRSAPPRRRPTRCAPRSPRAHADLKVGATGRGPRRCGKRRAPREEPRTLERGTALRC